jgi:chromosome partitioning protein
MQIIAVTNAKGGVGKTSTVVSLAAVLARNYKVLVLDLDFQVNATLSLGVGRDKLRPSVYNLLEGSIESVIRPTAVPGLNIITGSPELLQLEQYVKARDWLRRQLQLLPKDYDFVLIDTSPSLSLLTINAICAADRLIVPVQPQYLAAEGVTTLLEMLSSLRSYTGGNAGTVLGVLLSITHRRRADREMGDIIRQTLGDIVFNTEIPFSDRQYIASSRGLPVVITSPRSAISRAYRSLGEEVLQRLKKTTTQEL